MNYTIYRTGEVDVELLTRIAAEQEITPATEALMLPFGDKNQIGREKRMHYFGAALDGTETRFVRGNQLNVLEKAVRTNRIVSFGNCNVACPYCKRDCQFIDNNGIPIVAISVSLFDLAALCEGAVAQGETVRFSGGDPVMFPRHTLTLATYVWERYGQKVSIAHNGSGTRWVERMLPYLESAAIDLKAVPERMGQIMGIGVDKGAIMYDRSLKTQHLLSCNGILLDVRTPIFGDTSTEDMLRLASDIVRVNDRNHTFWTWRLYKPVEGCDWLVPGKDTVIQQMKIVSIAYPTIWMGLRAKWERGGMMFIKAGKVRTETHDTVHVSVPEFGSGNKLTRVSAFA